MQIHFKIYTYSPIKMHYEVDNRNRVFDNHTRTLDIRGKTLTGEKPTTPREITLYYSNGDYIQMSELSFWCLFTAAFTMNNLVQEPSSYSHYRLDYIYWSYNHPAIRRSNQPITICNHKVYPCCSISVELPHKTVTTNCLPIVPIRLLWLAKYQPHR